MKLIDCFMYFDEDLVLDIRLNTLKDVVDKFVIAESTFDHAGNKKKLNFNIQNFSKFKNKINYLVVENLPAKTNFFDKYLTKSWKRKPSWIRENYQRNYLNEGYRDYKDEDLIMISDIDEIPNPNKIQEFDTSNKYGCFEQDNFQSKINLLNTTRSKWIGTKICKKKDLISPQWLRNIKIKKKAFWKFYKPDIPQVIKNGGWHFSFLKSSIDISKKISAYAHQEYNKRDYLNVSSIEEKIKNKKDILDRDFIYVVKNLDTSFPKYILKNQEKFKKWIC